MKRGWLNPFTMRLLSTFLPLNLRKESKVIEAGTKAGNGKTTLGRENTILGVSARL